MSRLLKEIYFLFLFSFIICNALFGQSNNTDKVFDKISDLDYNNPEPDSKKLETFYTYKKEIENTIPFNDSAYVLVLLKISKYEVLARQDYEGAIHFASDALKAAAKSGRQSLKPLIINCYYNLASSYQYLMLYKQALVNYDSVIFLCDKDFIDTKNFQLSALYYKTSVCFLLGDYQKIIDACSKGINLSLAKNDSSRLTYFFNRKAYAYHYINNINAALGNVFIAMSSAQKMKDTFELITSYKLLGFIYEKKKMIDSAEFYFKKAIAIDEMIRNFEQTANDYIDLGNFYLNNSEDFKNAEYCYTQALYAAENINYLAGRSSKLALANFNLGENYLSQNKFKQASTYFLESFKNLKIDLHDNIKENASSLQLSIIAYKELVLGLLSAKTKYLLSVYKINRDTSYLNACIKTALVTDSVITQIRHEQTGELSKLYGRDKTRDFYAAAIEGSYLNNNPSLTFLLMEKSRAVLLNDKLNEINASAYLPYEEAKKEESFQVKIVELEQKLTTLNEASKEYQNIQLQLIDIKNELEQLIQSLEQKYPAYYQYKYDDKVPSLKNLQNYLAKNNQGFVHFFSGDTATYILSITATGTKFIRLSQKDFDREKLSELLQLCANKQVLNNHYNDFARLSNSIYEKLFQPLQLPKGRIVVCLDNIVIPFDALCEDSEGKKFLLYDYSFSYAYSARFLMKQFNNASPKGNFAGFAPVSFVHSLDVVDLKNAAIALKASAAYYKNDKLFTHENATRHNFFNYASSYSIVSVFSHARADTTDNEPVLFMQDSVIHLSELNYLNNPATKLVLLSACQTNVGKAATGEGIYSLARGFAAAGIPSVAATLWKADEQTIYSISEKFNEYLSEGMNKDEALQKAKLYFIQNNGSEKLLPYYWANMILIGNADNIQFESQHNNNYLLWGGAGILLLASTIMFFKKRKPKA